MTAEATNTIRLIYIVLLFFGITVAIMSAVTLWGMRKSIPLAKWLGILLTTMAVNWVIQVTVRIGHIMPPLSFCLLIFGLGGQLVATIRLGLYILLTGSYKKQD